MDTTRCSQLGYKQPRFCPTPSHPQELQRERPRQVDERRTSVFSCRAYNGFQNPKARGRHSGDLFLQHPRDAAATITRFGLIQFFLLVVFSAPSFHPNLFQIDQSLPSSPRSRRLHRPGLGSPFWSSPKRRSSTWIPNGLEGNMRLSKR